MPTNVRDPRTIITPSAFRLDRELLGTPLATPWRRLWALLIDLVVIGLLTVFLDSIQLLVWGVVALFFLRVALKRTGKDDPTAAVLLRISAGCLGLTILSAVLVAWLVFQLASGEGDDGTSRVDRIAEAVGTGELADLQGLEDVLRGVGEMRRLESAGSPAEAEEAALAALEATRDVPGMDDEARLEMLEELTPDDASWADEADEIFERALARFEAEGAAPDDRATSPPAEATAEAEAIREEVAALSDAEALDAFGELMAQGAGLDTLPEEDPRAVRARLLRSRLAGVVAADTLDALADRARSLERERDRAERRHAAAQEELADQENSFAALLRDIWDQLGSAIGLWSIYFTVLTTVFAGQTIGKKAMGLQVVRLDGEPMTWWTSFERAGGYIAGLATGLLGFAQVFWDPNRQCIHDKIVGTVVVKHGVPPVPGAWKEAGGVILDDEKKERP